jgi:hypothetical protein
VTDASLKPDPTRKGSYYRRIEDIGRALVKLDVARLPPATQFVTYFFACEKLAHGIVGIANRRAASDQYSHRNRLRLTELKAAAAVMNLSITPFKLDCVFADLQEQRLLTRTAGVQVSARILRNKLTHDFGPTNIDKILGSASILIPMMSTFLNCTQAVLAYQRTHFTYVP